MLATTLTRLVSVTDRIRHIAALRPHDPAIAHGDQGISFGELELRSTSLARRLRQEGAIQCEEPVALLMNRSIDFVVAALAVMKAGGAYLPIDPVTPQARRQLILEDSGAKLVIGHRCVVDCSGQTEPPWPCPLWIYESEVDCPVASHPEPFDAEESHHQDRLAYIIYTSGSTGQPKGVEITHGNLATLLDWHQRAFDVTPADKASQLAGPGFDAAVWETWANLCAGASLHIAPEWVRTSAPALQDWLLTCRITVAFAPTVIAHQLIAMKWPESGNSLRVLLTGAERLLQRPPADLPFLFFNNYGPTECTVVATSGLVDAAGSSAPSIGLPANGARLQIDEQGELWIAGPLVGRGYRNRPQQTAERFSEWQGVRAYRTGDRVRQLPNGEIEFLGRFDDQVKIRGYRVEPGEIVAALMKHPAVSAAVVIAREDVVPGEKVLVGYTVAAPGCKVEISCSALRAHLAGLLPDYMIPVEMLTLASLPLTPNGKVDTAALPAPTATAVQPPGGAATADEGTHSQIQRQVGEIVAKLLRKPDVDPDANIFLLGGHSLLAAQLLVQVNRAFGVKLALRQMFQLPTVNALARELAGRKAAAV